MIEVKLQLFDAVELAGLQSFYAAMQERRMNIIQAQVAAQQKAAQQTGAPDPAAANEAAPPAEPPAPVAQADGDAGAETADPKAIFKAYLDAHGFAAARKKLDAVGAQRFSDVPAEKLPAFLASLRGPA